MPNKRKVNVKKVQPHKLARTQPITVASIQCLNQDTLYYIFSNFLNDKELLTLSLVCKLWRKVIDEKVIPNQTSKVMPVPATPKAIYFFIKKNMDNIAKNIYELLTSIRTQYEGWAEVLYYPDSSEIELNGMLSTGIHSYFSKVIATLNNNKELDILMHMQKKGYNLLALGKFKQSFLHLFAFTNDVNVLKFLIKTVGLDISAKDTSFTIPPVVWRIFGSAYSRKISFSFEILNVLLNEKTDVNYIFYPIIYHEQLEEESIIVESPLLILRRQFTHLKTPIERQEHFKCLALLAKHYKVEFDIVEISLTFEEALIDAGYTNEDVQCICKELANLQATQVELPENKQKKLLMST